MFNKWFKPTIPILRINSGIDHNSAKLVEESLKPLTRMKALAVIINSNGGMLVQGELMKKKIELFAKTHKIPLYTFAEDSALSAGYYLLSIGNKIFVDEASLVGSIGVLYLNLKIEKLTRKLGFEPRKFSSNKKLFQNYTGFNDERNEEMERIIKDQFGIMRQQFFDHCDKYRPQLQKQDGDVKDLIYNANIFTGIEAVKYGLADEIGNFEEVLNRLHPDCQLRDITRIPLAQYYIMKQQSQ
ncbi:unnamed protein product [Paramecium pentaurelia]|uniref:Peptidase S49 domain-containing protein n=1 Tax=Paramecium pentaurelia TaxID=43138 RepID=A0A8S1RW42_9CILI|nr:unnamed protein product [Paramecium pentaurelia]